MNRTIAPIQTIVNFMGWNKMPAAITLDAVRTIVRNNICLMADTTGDSITAEEELCLLRDMIANGDTTQDNIWLNLFIDDYQTLNDMELAKQALALRDEIEELMMNGKSFKNARKEWDI